MGKEESAEGSGDKQRSRPFPVVGIGASAGGLEAFRELLDHLPVDTGMAFVFIQHLDPTHESMLTQILSKATEIPVLEVKDGMPVESDHVYVIPPNTNLAIFHDALHLMPRTEARGQHMPIDHFFRSLAEDQKGKAIGVILSGTASDGMLGLKAIKAEGGISFAQDSQTAKYVGMPNSAVAAGCVDFVLSPERIAKELSRLGQHPYVVHPQAAEEKALPDEKADDLNRIFLLLRDRTGVDFAHYKRTSIRRRIHRRMVLHRLDKLADYVRYIQSNASEAEALYQDILISVTGFFRDPETFQALKEKVFTPIMASERAAFRIWVPGCSTGEEVYSIAMSLLEFLEDRSSTIPIQIFGTDINESAIERARTGIYPAGLMSDISPERMRRFFVELEEGYRINKPIRDMCVFARQDATRDPPFSRLDLISCRNVLIYLGAPLQKRVLPIFHYALKPSGFLLLGNSESIGGFSNLFASVDSKHKIYAKKVTPIRQEFSFAFSDYERKGIPFGEEKAGGPAEKFDLEREAERVLLSRYAPAGIIINDDMEILHFRGDTAPYLKPPAGVPSFHLSKMVREGLLLRLREAIQKAHEKGVPVREGGVRIQQDNGPSREIQIEVVPLRSPSSEEQYFLVLFEDAPSSVPAQPEETDLDKTEQDLESSQIVQLEHELMAAREYTQSLIERQETTNEELRSANEEILSSNEELQSTNEELETAKEELQSTNEELTAMNEELQNLNLELSQVNDDLVNLFSNVDIAIVMTGNDLRIRRFTPAVGRVLNLIASDVGRRIGDIQPNIVDIDLETVILRVMDTLQMETREIQDREGRWYSMRVRPYRTADRRIDGVVMVWLDIDALKSSAEETQAAREYAEAIVETVREPLLVLGRDLQVKTANRAFYRTFQASSEDTEGQFIYDLGDGQWDIPQLRTLLEEILPQNTQFEGFGVEHSFPKIGHKRMVLNARRVQRREEASELILLAIEDITEKE